MRDGYGIQTWPGNLLEFIGWVSYFEGKFKPVLT